MSGRDYKGGAGAEARGQLHKASIATDRLRAGMIEPGSWDFSPTLSPPRSFRLRRQDDTTEGRVTSPQY